MNSTHGSRFEALQQCFPTTHDTAAVFSGFEIIKEKIIAIAAGHHQWPDPRETHVTISHAIYMEPILGSPGEFQPFWGLPPRFYYQLDLGWPVLVAAWLNYNIRRRTDGQCAGDSGFPSGATDHCVVGGLLDRSSLFSSYVPGELLVGFRDDVDESAARRVVARELPDSQVLGAVWSIRVLQITCVPFDEIKQGTRIESADEVRYAEVNSHISLIVPGGFWKTTQLVKALA